MKMKNNFLGEIYKRLSLFKRYRDTPVIQQESISEHSFFVILIAEELSRKYKLNYIQKLKVLEMALFHDVAESFSDDFTYEMKHISGSEKFKEAVVEIEDEIINKISNELDNKNIKNLINEYKERKSIESKIVKLADWYSVIFYCKMEMERGNEGKILQIYKRAKNSIEKLEK